jgi:hypothetical protein
MEHSETFTAFFLSSSLFQWKGGNSYQSSESSLVLGQLWYSLSIYDRIYPLKPKNPI